MKNAHSSIPESEIWERIQFTRELSIPAARALIDFQFSPFDHERMSELSAKARTGTLTAKENAEIEAYERLGCLLDILHSKARQALRRRSRAS